MRTPRSRASRSSAPRSSAVVVALARALAFVVALAGGGVAAAAGPTVVAASAGAPVRAASAGAAAPAPSIVVLRAPSVADRVAAAGGEVTEAAERAWSAAAFHAQEAVLVRLARAGAAVRPDRRFTRAVDGFSASLTAVQIAAFESDPAVAGVYPSRRAFALPVERPRSGGAVPGLGGGGAGVAVAAIGSGAAQAAALGAAVTATAPGAVMLPVVVEGPPTTAGLLAALERALDPDGDGDCHDAARVLLLGVIEPLAALPDAPSARAVAGAAALDVVVVVPVGESGPAGSLYGSLAGPAGSSAALTVAAGELRAGAVRPAAGSSAGLAPGGAGSFVLAPGRHSVDAAAAVAAEAALLLQARPGLGSRTVRAIVEGSARPATLAVGGGVVDLAAALAAEVAVELSPLAAGGRGTATVRNVSSRPLRVAVAVEGAGTALPRSLALSPGAAARVVVRVGLPGRAAGAGAGAGAVESAGAGTVSGTAAGAISVGALVVTPEGGPVARARWVRAAPRPVPLLADVTLTPPPDAALSDATPARLSVRAGAVLGAGANRQLRPLARLDVELWSSTRRLGLLARLRDVLPGRYLLALTGRGPDGARLAAGRYGLRVIAVSADGTPAQQRDLSFTVHKTIVSRQ